MMNGFVWSVLHKSQIVDWIPNNSFVSRHQLENIALLQVFGRKCFMLFQMIMILKFEY